MALPPLADLHELNARVVEDVRPGDERAMAALDDASTEVRHHAGRTWTDENNELDNPPAIAVRIALRLAKDIFENPYGYRSEQIGEYAYQRQSGGMLTDAEIRQLEELAGDLVSVPTVSTLKVSGKSGLILDEYRRQEAGWL